MEELLNSGRKYMLTHGASLSTHEDNSEVSDESNGYGIDIKSEESAFLHYKMEPLPPQMPACFCKDRDPRGCKKHNERGADVLEVIRLAERQLKAIKADDEGVLAEIATLDDEI